MTDGPFAEGKEHLGGFTVISVPDLDAALEWGRRISEITTLPCEVWPLRMTRRRLSTPCPARTSSGCSERNTGGRCRSWSACSATSTSPRTRSRTPSPAPRQRWPADGLPPSPAGWIITTARNRAIDRLRREASRSGRHAQAALLHAGQDAARTSAGGTGSGEEGPVRDDRLRLIFTCCHPALARRPGRADAAAARRAEHRARSRTRSWCPSRPWPSGWSGPRARSGTRGSPTGSRARPTCPAAWPPCWPWCT